MFHMEDILHQVKIACMGTEIQDVKYPGSALELAFVFVISLFRSGRIQNMDPGPWTTPLTWSMYHLWTQPQDPDTSCYRPEYIMENMLLSKPLEW